MLTYIIIFFVAMVLIGGFLSFMGESTPERPYREEEDNEDGDLTEEEIEYEYLQRMEEEQDEEDEYLSRHGN